jgi:4-amino-4-deoxy-L-arabinose transferase-like glycosyltransferase
MDKTQKRNLWILVWFGIIYFLLFIIPNASTLGSDNRLAYLSQDEYVTYPIIERMLAFEGDIHNIWGKLIIYGDYHYGYPFYFFSMLVLLPFRLIHGSDFFNHTPFNILLLRQFINVVPNILTAGILTYLQTRFKSWWKSLLVFLLVLTIPAVVRSNMHWWHPDLLMMLSIALTFLFLDLDDYRLGKYFYLAAAACGMASAIKLMGFFFFLAIPVYLVITWRKKHPPLKKLLTAALVFVLVMTAVIILSNPFIFYKGPREDMLAIQGFKTEELSAGYTHDDSPYYAVGPQYWRWTLKVSYGRPWTLYVFAASLFLGCLYNQRREMNWLLFAWVLPIGIYLMWFVAPKPDHYLLPLMVPLYPAITNLLYPIEAHWQGKNKWINWLAGAGLLLFSLFMAAQLHYQVLKDLSLFYSYLPS